MKTMPIEEARKRLDALSVELNVSGQTIGLTRDGRLVLRLGPSGPAANSPRITGREVATTLESIPGLPESDAEQFARDVERGIEWSRTTPQFNPWAS
jgi:hypothetical protein